MADLNLLRALLEEELAKTRPGRQPASDEMIVDPMSFTQNSSSVMPMDRSTMSDFEQLTPMLNRFNALSPLNNQGSNVATTAENTFKSAPMNQRTTDQGTRADYKGATNSIIVKPGVLEKKDLDEALKLRKEMPGYLEQKALLDQIDQFYPELMRLSAARPVGPDLTPALKLSDSFFGSNFASGYKPPQAEDLEQMLSDYFKTKAAQQAKFSDNEVDFLKAVITPGTTLKVLEQLGLQNSASAGVGRPPSLPASLYGYDRDKIEADTQKLGKDLDFKGISGVFQRINELIPGGVDNWNSSSDIPGAGYSKFAPTFMLSAEGDELRKLVSSLMNKEIYTQSGAQITNQEFARLATALGTDALGDDRALVQGLRNWRETFHDIMTQRQAKYRPEVVQNFRGRGGETAEDFKVRTGLNKRLGFKPKSDEELNAMTLEQLKAYNAEMSGGSQ